MSRYRRARDGQTYFFTLVSYWRRPILCTTPIRNALRSALIEVRQRRPFEIDAWVLMPDHLHTIWTLPPDDADYSTRWALIKRLVSRSCATRFDNGWQPSASRIKHRDTSIWHRRFYEHKVRDECDLEKHMDYLHLNPVKHEHTGNAAAWPLSTFHRYVREGVYPVDCGWDGTRAAGRVGLRQGRGRSWATERQLHTARHVAFMLSMNTMPTDFSEILKGARLHHSNNLHQTAFRIRNTSNIYK